MKAVGVFPDRIAWKVFIERVLLWLGVLGVVIGVLFFIAFNWGALGKMGKFALVETLIVLSLFPLLRYEASSHVGQFALLGASILVGVLLGLFGQIYQTGADTWQLFASWAILILPWVWLGRFDPLWIVWVAICNAWLILYFVLFPSPFFGIFDEITPAFVVLVFNALVTVFWEFSLRTRPQSSRLALRIPATLTGVAATLLGIWAVMDDHRNHLLWFMIWLFWLSTFCLFYRYKVRDLFMLTGACLSAIVMFVVFLGKLLIDSHTEFLGFLMITFALIATGTGATTWLKYIARTWEETHD